MPGKLQPAWLANLDKNRSGDDAEQESITPLARDMNVVAKNPFLMRAALFRGTQRRCTATHRFGAACTCVSPASITAVMSGEPFDSAIRY
jgi:hypothetical protein